MPPVMLGILTGNSYAWSIENRNLGILDWEVSRTSNGTVVATCRNATHQPKFQFGLCDVCDVMGAPLTAVTTVEVKGVMSYNKKEG